jgi:uncharacterized protein YecT (DUF1311 family)
MRQYNFYIRDGKAVQHPVGGGNIISFAGSSSNPAVNVQAQGSKVIVTYENGMVQEWPWPGEGGNIITRVEGNRNRKPQPASADYSSSEVTNSDTYGNSSSEASPIFSWIGFGIALFFASVIWWNGKWDGLPLFKLQFLIGELTIAGVCYGLKSILGKLVEFVFGLALIAICIVLGLLLLGYLIKDDSNTSTKKATTSSTPSASSNRISTIGINEPKIPKAEIVQKSNREANSQSLESSSFDTRKSVDSKNIPYPNDIPTARQRISFEDADKELNGLYKRIISQLSSEAQSNLKISQRKWIKEKEGKDPEMQKKLTLDRIEELKSTFKQ